MSLPPFITPENIKTACSGGLIGGYYTIYVEQVGDNSMPWEKRIEMALDAAICSDGTAEVILPSGYIDITDTIKWSGSRGRDKKIARRRTNHIVLRGPGGMDSTHLRWKGDPNKPVIYLENSPSGCRISDLEIDVLPQTQDGNDRIPGVVGIKYDTKWYYDPKTKWCLNTSRFNTFQRLHIRNCDICIDIGDNWGPDFTNLAVYDTWLEECRIGIRLTGANVACIYFYNMTFGHYREAGIKSVCGESMRIDNPEVKSNKLQELTRNQKIDKPMIPEGVENNKNMRKEVVNEETGEKETWIYCGGAPTFVVQNVNATTRFPDAWLFDIPGGVLRVYSVRQEGVGGVFRANVHSGGRFGDILVDVVSTAPGVTVTDTVSEPDTENNVYEKEIEVKGVAIQYKRTSQLVLVGGGYSGDIRLYNKAIPVFSTGVKFMMPREVDLNRAALGLPHPTFTGFGAQLHQVPMIFQESISVPNDIIQKAIISKQIGFISLVPKIMSVQVKFDPLHSMPDNKYQVSVCPNWNSGNWWVENKTIYGFDIHFSNYPTDYDAKIDVTASHRSWERFK